MNNKVNYKKGYKREILILMYKCGVIPADGIRLLSEDPAMFYKAVRQMEERGIIERVKKGNKRYIRLLNYRTRHEEYEEYLSQPLIDYYKDTVYDVTIRLNGNSENAPIKAYKDIMGKIMMYCAGAEIGISEDGIDLSTDNINERFNHYYTSTELKHIELYEDAYQKEGRNTEKKLASSRLNGLLISPGGIYATYVLNNYLIEWERFGESKMAHYIKNFVRRKSEIPNDEEKTSAVIIANNQKLFIDLCKNDYKNPKKVEHKLMNIDYVYDRLYAITQDREGTTLLSVLTKNSWRATILYTILTPTEIENAKMAPIACDGYNKEKDEYKLVFCIPDLVKLKTFCTRACIEENKNRYSIYCFTSQLPIVASLVGTNANIYTMPLSNYIKEHFREVKIYPFKEIEERK